MFKSIVGLQRIKKFTTSEKKIVTLVATLRRWNYLLKSSYKTKNKISKVVEILQI